MKSAVIGRLVLSLFVSGTAIAAVSPESRMRMLKGELVPHTIMIETALKTSIDEISGIRDQLNSNELRKSPQSVENLKSYGREIRMDLHTIVAHEAELRSAAEKYPDVASSKEFREASAAVDEVKSAVQRWDQKAQSSSYWVDRQMVASDLDALETRISDALGKTRALNSSQLDFSSNVG